MGVLAICDMGYVVIRCRCREVHDPVKVHPHAIIEHHHVDRLANWQWIVAHDGHLPGPDVISRVGPDPALVNAVGEAIADRALREGDHFDIRAYALIAVETVLDWQGATGSGP